MSAGPSRLERAVEVILSTGLAVSAAALLAGLAVPSVPALRVGVVLLMFTPVARVAVLSAALLYARDWLFAVLSLTVLGVLASSAWLGLAVRR